LICSIREDVMNENVTNAIADPAYRAEIRALIANNPLFERFTPIHLDQLVSIVGDPVSVADGEIVMREGDYPPDNVYILRKGSVKILKNEPDSDVQYQIAVLNPGDTIGEVALLDDGPRSATVVALEDTSLLVIPIDKLSAMASADDSVDSRMKINLAYELGQRLRTTNESTVRNLREKLAEAETRAEMGKFISNVLIGTCVYMFALGVLSVMAKEAIDTTMISVPILFGFAIGLFVLIKNSAYPFSAYGITTENWRYAIKDSLLWTMGMLVLVVGVKAVMVYTVPAFKGLPVFDFYQSKNTTLGMALLAAGLYALFVPIQEGVARCGLQSSFQMFLTGKYRVLVSILISNLLFSATHLHVSIKLALLVFPVGVFWGWLYYRHNTVIGIIVSHIIVGLFALFAVGFTSL